MSTLSSTLSTLSTGTKLNLVRKSLDLHRVFKLMIRRNVQIRNFTAAEILCVQHAKYWYLVRGTGTVCNFSIERFAGRQNLYRKSSEFLIASAPHTNLVLI